MKSYSQAGQDLFAFAMTGGKTKGYFLDIGCNHESFHSNTYGLEQLGWTGLLVDIAGGCENRKGKFVLSDASNPTEELLVAYSQMPAVVDFMSLDVDDALIPSLKEIPFEWHSFGVVCLEHDQYRVGPEPQKYARGFMLAQGYELVCGNVIIPDYGVAEDWFVHPEYASADLIENYRCDNKDWREIMK